MWFFFCHFCKSVVRFCLNFYKKLWLLFRVCCVLQSLHRFPAVQFTLDELGFSTIHTKRRHYKLFFTHRWGLVQLLSTEGGFTWNWLVAEHPSKAQPPQSFPIISGGRILAVFSASEVRIDKSRLQTPLLQTRIPSLLDLFKQHHLEENISIITKATNSRQLFI